jgi:hypothetical protein
MKHFSWILLTLSLLLTACPGPTAPSQLYIDPAKGLETNPGSLDKPLKTLKAALVQASSGPTKTVVLLAGIYDGASGETWGYTVPDGVTVKANSAGVVLAGLQGKVALTLSGSAALSFLTLKGFDLAVQASAGSPTLTGVIFQENKTALKLSGSAQATLTDVTFSGNVPFSAGDTLAALLLSDSAQATLNNPIFKDTFPSTLTGQSKIILNGGSASGFGSAVMRMSGSSRLSCQGFSAQNILSSQTVLNLSENSLAELNKCSYLLQSGAGDASLAFLSGSAQISLQEVSALGDLELGLGGAATRATVVGGFVGIVYSSGILTISGSSHRQLILSGGSATVTNATISNSINSSVYVGGGNLKLRGSKISSSSNGMGLLVANTVGVLPPDLGSPSDPGNNNFAGGEGVGLEVNAPVQVSAVGNTWKANVQGANAQGQYASATVSGPAGNRTKDFNYYLLTGSSVRF